MKYQIIGAASIAAVALVGIANTSAGTNTGGGHDPIGPDVVCWFTGGGGALDMNLYGSQDGINSFAFGTTSCNFGDMVADWYSGTNRVPVIAQTCYRLKDGRFEQIATAWLKHCPAPFAQNASSYDLRWLPTTTRYSSRFLASNL